MCSLLVPAFLVLIGLNGIEPGIAREHELSGSLDVRFHSSDSEGSWLDGGLGKLRFDEEDDPVVPGALLLRYEGRWTRTTKVRVVGSVYDDVDRLFGLTEAFLEYRPVPRSAYRFQVRAGAFYPPLSLENVDPGWTSPYSTSFSSVNTWIGEELRTLGVELQATRMGKHVRSPHDLGIDVALFQGNDPAGALVSWRGWAIHDRQTRLFERLPLAELPAFGPRGSFPPQESFEEPFFSEIDGRTGYYLGGRWEVAGRSRLRLHRYDNRGDPRAFEGGQWAWRTRFHHLGWHLRFPGGTEVIVQALGGDTEMAGRSEVLVHADYRAGFLLASHAWGAHRLSLRYDDFEVVDGDAIPDDPNDENGHGWTAAWRFDGGDLEKGRWRIGLELLSVTSSRPARALLGGSVDRRERSVQLKLEWRF